MKLQEIVSFFEEIAPFSYQESYDNSGIQIGSPDTEITGILISIDLTNEVLDEAIENNINLILTHHPLIFNGIKKLTGGNMVEKLIVKAIKNDINLLSVHTNIDSVINGVSGKISDKLGLISRKVLDPVKGKLLKLVYFVPVDHAEKVRKSIFEAGAGVIGNYENCSFSSEGRGSFKAGENTNPFAGTKNKLHYEKELRVETILPVNIQGKVISALINSHPYEEVAFDLYPLDNAWQSVGLGMIGEFEEEMEEHDFLNAVKTIFNTGCVRYTDLRQKKIKKVAICGGSGSFLLSKAIAAGADAFISADFKYHQFFDAEGKLIIVDIGHYESEQFTKELFYELLTKKFPTFALLLSEVNTNPINYL
ncbi:MAG: Nif3-like dinuclear metal center hexameric protein [Bacteroidales bacterium]|nr:Nif3-like dinuclear metal center hexameric protein [Bacteroidales bacterium]MCF8391024.1 Nif3-like dinuclear metal center hexameric protein [Bacteroidales bacterium]